MAEIKITKGAHWRNEIQKAFDEFRKNEVNKEVYEYVSLYCQNIIINAVKFRMNFSRTEGHDYTGNLLNSICVALYKDGELEDYYTPENDVGTRSPKFRKMSVGRKKRYVFQKDFMGVRSTYSPTIETDEQTASESIAHFLNTYSPTVKKGFCVAVAYTVEYAKWVATERGTTGYLQTKNFATRMFRRVFKQIG